MPGIGLMGGRFGGTATAPSITIGIFSDAGHSTPITEADFGDTVYIQATASNFTATRYRFFYGTGNNLTEIADQVSNEYAWTVNAIGDLNIVAIATDASNNEEIDSTPLTVQSDADAVTYLTNAGISNDGTVYFSGTPQEVTGSEYYVLVSAFFVSLKQNGLFDKGFWGRLGIGGTAAAHKLNIFNPLDTDAAFRGTFNGGWTHDKEGYTSNGVNAYCNNHFNPSTHQAANDGAYACYLRSTSDGTAGNFVWGVSANVSNQSNFLPKTTIDRSFYGIGGNPIQFNGLAISDTDGMHIVTRTASNITKWIGNGVLIDSTTDAFGYHPNFNTYSGARNNSGTPLYGQATTFSFEGEFEGLSDAEAANLRTAVDTLMTALNLNV